MKLYYFSATVIFLLSSCMPSLIVPSDPRYRSIENGNELSIGDRYIPPDTGYYIPYEHYTRGSFDGTSFDIEVDKEGNVSVSGLEASRGIHQNELNLMMAQAVGHMKKDTLFLTINSTFSKVYLVHVDSESVLDSFETGGTLVITSEDYEGETGSLVFAGHPSQDVIALPQNVGQDKVFDRTHRKKHVAIFNTFEFRSGSYSKSFPPGDYVVVGGNQLMVK